MKKVKMGALCKKEFQGSLSSSFSKGVLYPAESKTESEKMYVCDNNGRDVLIDKKDFRNHFDWQELALPPQMEKEDSAHWKEVMELAQKYGLIVQAYGGTATLISRGFQLTELGLKEFLRIQKMNGITRSTLGYPFNGKTQEESEGVV